MRGITECAHLEHDGVFLRGGELERGLLKALLRQGLVCGTQAEPEVVVVLVFMRFVTLVVAVVCFYFYERLAY